MFVYYFYIVVAMTLLTIIMYGIDKIKAINGWWRIKESVLLLFSFLFGSIGGLFSMYVIRHKNRHIKFIILNWLFFILHLALGYYLFTLTY